GQRHAGHDELACHVHRAGGLPVLHTGVLEESEALPQLPRRRAESTLQHRLYRRHVFRGRLPRQDVPRGSIDGRRLPETAPSAPPCRAPPSPCPPPPPPPPPH